MLKTDDSAYWSTSLRLVPKEGFEPILLLRQAPLPVGLLGYDGESRGIRTPSAWATRNWVTASSGSSTPADSQDGVKGGIEPSSSASQAAALPLSYIHQMEEGVGFEPTR